VVQYASQGDPRRSMELLWGRVAAAARGPRPGLSVVAIVEEAVRIADEDGLDAVSMRAVGRRLGRTGMSLYTYVPSKAELVDLMLDAVLTELEQDYLADGGGWRAGMERWAREAWAFYQRHPWVLHVSGSRATLGPHELGAYEAQLAVLAELPIAGLELARIVNAVASLVRGSAKAVADARAARQVTGMSDDEWWNARAPILDEFLPFDVRAERFPMIVRLAGEQAYEEVGLAEPGGPSYLEAEALDTFEFGLGRLLDGIEVDVARQTGGA
jgi:AcrR family transcriptional regulator